MIPSKLTIGALNNMENKLSKNDIGRLRWERVVEAGADGRLQMCKSRKDVCELAGIPVVTRTQQAAGSGWVGHKVSQGMLVENVRPDGNEYFLTGKEPNYSPALAGRLGGLKKQAKKLDPKEPKVEKVEVIEEPKPEPKAEEPKTFTADITIKKGRKETRLSVKIENMSEAWVEARVGELLTKLK